jgi:hypothetical protein
MLTVKGLNGGEKALASSFAMSAAAFGGTREVRFLSGSKRGDHAQGEQLQCNWQTHAYFS